MRSRPVTAAALGIVTAAGGALAGVPMTVDLGLAQDDVWAYISAPDPANFPEISVWGSFGLDLNPEGFPGPQPGANFWSHGFIGWDLPAIPDGYRWGGATLTVTLSSGTWLPDDGDAFVRMLTGGFSEQTWNIFANTPSPRMDVDGIVGDDTGATGVNTTITFEIPADLDASIVGGWESAGQVYVAITADNAPPPPGTGGPGDLTGALQFFSSEDVFERGPRLVMTLLPVVLGDVNGDGVVDGADLGFLLGAWGECPAEGACAADFNDDGAVDGIDLGLLLGNWT